jgi:hypothetical protein
MSMLPNQVRRLSAAHGALTAPFSLFNKVNPSVNPYLCVILYDFVTGAVYHPAIGIGEATQLGRRVTPRVLALDAFGV